MFLIKKRLLGLKYPELNSIVKGSGTHGLCISPHLLLGMAKRGAGAGPVGLPRIIDKWGLMGDPVCPIYLRGGARCGEPRLYAGWGAGSPVEETGPRLIHFFKKISLKQQLIIVQEEKK